MSGRGGDRAASRDRPGGDRGNRPSTTDRAKGGGDPAKGGGADRAKVSDRSRNAARGGGGRDTAFRNVSSGRAASLQSARGQASLGGRAEALSPLKGPKAGLEFAAN